MIDQTGAPEQGVRTLGIAQTQPERHVHIPGAGKAVTTLVLDILLWIAFVLITCVAMYAAWDQIGKWTAPPAAVAK